jgi:hypothetical protein
MRFRPWPIVILAAAHCLAPLFNGLYSAWLQNVSMSSYWNSTFQTGQWLSMLAYLLSLPVAGIAIFKTKRWSYPVFLSIMGWALYSNFLSWHEFPQYFGTASLLFTYAINIGVMSYFLIPEVREVYFNPRLRWWETKPRYDISIPTALHCLDREGDGTLVNVSEGGAFVETPMILFFGSEVQISFQSLGQSPGKTIYVKSKVVHVRRAKPAGYGLECVHTVGSFAEMKEFVREVKNSGALERMGNVSLTEEFFSWSKTVLRTGQGLIPNAGKSRSNSEAHSNDQNRAA